MPIRDPHVVALVYKAKPPKGFVYHEPPPVEAETETFRIQLDDWRLRIEPKNHFASPDEVRPQTDALVRSWVIASSLERGFPEIDIEYESAEIIDRTPPVAGTIEGFGVLSMSGRASMTATGTVISNRYAYPEPPLTFTASPDVETVWGRYQGYLRGREPLPSMAYFCFTVVKSVAGGVKKAAKRFAIDSRVLSKLSELSSTKGDTSDARKIDPHHPLVALTQAERRWLDATVREIIRRVGQRAAGVRPDELRMSGLPPLASSGKS